ncbi:signal transduction histidine kinase [Brevibacterium paucivorans]|uniref:Signal transduction histidine kinase n=1 Tax=Brevibacterium paucivorans TaxID=170994 RepID=A0ABS2SIV3_9MICO|nr:histidine kinase [Brevibacterium paucivorans]MBM7816182.1 signal transduction histidine kinase [Brevibacterium paucivorans]
MSTFKSLKRGAKRHTKVLENKSIATPLVKVIVAIRMLFIYPVIASWTETSITSGEPLVLALLALESLVAFIFWDRIKNFVSRHPLILSIDILLVVIAIGPGQGISPYFLYLGATAVLIGLLYDRQNRTILATLLIGSYALIPLILRTTPATYSLYGAVESCVSVTILVVLVLLGSRLHSLQQRVDTAVEIASRNAREATLGEERSRIARELHDSTVKSLVGINLLSATIQKQPQNAVKTAELIQAAATSAIAESRQLLSSLRQGDAANFDETLQASLEEIEVVHGVEVRLSNEGGQFPSDLQYNVRKIIEEAVTNSAVHSGTDYIDVAIHRDGDSLTARVSDYGTGFRYAHKKSGHIGIASMRERAAEIGGLLTLTSVPDKGTTVTLHISDVQRTEVEQHDSSSYS